MKEKTDLFVVCLLTLSFLSSGCVTLEVSQSPGRNSGGISSENSRTMPDLSIAELEKQVHQQVNQYRKSLNLPPLELNSQISTQARNHSQDMAKQGGSSLSHDGFEQRVKAIAGSIPYRSAAENVAYSLGHGNPVEVAVEGWIESSGHRQNMEGDFGLTGVGIAQNRRGEYYFTQIFIKRR